MPIDIPQLMQKVGQLRVTTRRLVDTTFGGEYHSVFKGHGIEFDEVRDYTPGDDIRTIDWNVTARMGRPFVKRFREERELTILFLVDVSASQGFASAARSKAETAAELACVLALSAIRNKDRVGLTLFSDRIDLHLPPRRGPRAALRIVRDILAADQARGGTDINAALRFLNSVQKRRAVVFLISDFLDTGYEPALRTAAGRHDIIAAHISDPAEHSLPHAGLLEVEDPESGQRLMLDTRDPATRQQFHTRATQHHNTLTTLCRSLNIDLLPLSTTRPFTHDLHSLFRTRLKRTSHAR